MSQLSRGNCPRASGLKKHGWSAPVPHCHPDAKGWKTYEGLETELRQEYFHDWCKLCNVTSILFVTIVCCKVRCLYKQSLKLCLWSWLLTMFSLSFNSFSHSPHPFLLLHLDLSWLLNSFRSCTTQPMVFISLSISCFSLSTGYKYFHGCVTPISSCLELFIIIIFTWDLWSFALEKKYWLLINKHFN